MVQSVEMTRENPHVKFPAQVLMDLAATRPFRTYGKDGHLHVCFDKKLKQNAFNNFLLSHTPYRYSLGKPKAVETKTRRVNSKRTNKVCITTEDTSHSAYVSLPKIPQASESLVRKRNGLHNTREKVSKDLIEFESEEEHETCDFLSCGSVKIEEQSREAVFPPRPTIKETRSRSLPLIMNRGNSSTCLRSDARACKSLNKFQNGENPVATKMDRILFYPEKNASKNDEEFTTVTKDGAKVTVNQRRLSIEVFMPRTS